MTLIEFIKSNRTQDTPIGDLCRDIEGDLQFPLDQPEGKMISYLEFRTRRGGTDTVLREFLHEYDLVKGGKVDPLDVETRFAVLRAENWSFLKKNFPIDEVYLVGKVTDIYKVWCIDSINGKALLFNIKSEGSLNDLFLREASGIFVGDLTQIVTVEEAIRQLESCSYDTPVKPYMPNFEELLSFLKQNN
jgi:hypothetical protein